MVFSWYACKVWELDYHEISVNVLFHGMKNEWFLNITMRNREKREYHGKNEKMVLVECHETMKKVFCHGNDKVVGVKKYHEDALKSVLSW